MPTPLGALGRGIAAGTIASAVMGAFFKATSGVAPSPPRNAFTPPDAKQRSEEPTATIARRFMTGMMKRPLPARQKAIAANLVHYGFGAGWAAGYGLLRESFPRATKGPLAGLAFGTAVWAISDDVILPAFRLAPWPNRTPLAVHAYFLGAHFIFGAATWAAYEAMRRRPWMAVATHLWAWRAARRLPRFAQPAGRKAYRYIAEASATLH